MLPEHRQLLMRSNRLLGAGLVEANLVKLEDLEIANGKLLEIMSADQPRQSTVLGILAYQMKVLREEDLLQHVVDNEGTGLVDLRGYDVPDEVRKSTDIPMCWATWSVPFDHDEDFHFIATAYYLSPAVRSFWEKQFTGPILWFGTTLEIIADYLEKLAADRIAPLPPSSGGSPTPFGAGTGGSRPPFGGAGTRSPFGTVSPFPARTSNSPAPFPIKTVEPAPVAPLAPPKPPPPKRT
jgi:hypothetical protein